MFVHSLLILVACAPVASGHSYLAEPPSRNLVKSWAGQEYCPHCLQAGGPDTVKARGGVWPTALAPSSHGLCGDPVQTSAVPASFAEEPYMVNSPTQRVYKAGSTVIFRIGVSTHHKGHYEFRLCDKGLNTSNFATAKDAQDCLDQRILQRAPLDRSCKVNDARADCQPIDENHPGRWYLPPAGEGTPMASAQFSDKDASAFPAIKEIHVMRYVIPDDLTCTDCTIQWYWSTGNSCLYDADYITYFHKFRSLGWDADKWAPFGAASWATADNAVCGKGQNGFGEEFWNCADVSVVADDGSVESTTAAPGTTTVTTTQPVTTTSTVTTATASTYAPSTTPPPTPSTRQPCAPLASAACKSWCSSFEEEDWTAKCAWPQCAACGECTAEPSTTTEQVTTTTEPPQTTTETPAPPGGCTALWGQCGGVSFTGSTCCASDAHFGDAYCNRQSKWYSQCVPSASALQHASAQKYEVQTQAAAEHLASGDVKPRKRGFLSNSVALMQRMTRLQKAGREEARKETPAAREL